MKIRSEHPNSPTNPAQMNLPDAQESRIACSWKPAVDTIRGFANQLGADARQVPPDPTGDIEVANTIVGGRLVFPTTRKLDGHPEP